LQKLHNWISRLLGSSIFLVLLLLRPPSLRILVLMETTLVEEHACPASSEKHLENVVWIHVLFSVLLVISYSLIFSPMLIIYPSLAFIAQACECC